MNLCSLYVCKCAKCFEFLFCLCLLISYFILQDKEEADYVEWLKGQADHTLICIDNFMSPKRHAKRMCHTKQYICLVPSVTLREFTDLNKI